MNDDSAKWTTQTGAGSARPRTDADSIELILGRDDKAQRGVCAPQGFRAGGVAAGIKPDGALDCAAVVSDTEAAAAGVFTRNLVKAAPVLVSQTHLADPHARAAVFSSGNANAATGSQGVRVAEAMCAEAASVVGCKTSDVLIAQTGLIGFPMDVEIAAAGAHEAAAAAVPDGGPLAAEAMLTTDTVTKSSVVELDIGGAVVTVAGMAKGAAMLAPSMATMLAILTTDAAVVPEALQTALTAALDNSFHAVVIDAQSTNDTVFALANGASGAAEISGAGSPGYAEFAVAVAAVCRELAMAMVNDSEGATKFLTMSVSGAASEADARIAARAVCASPLVKCSLAGEDPYWGRVLSELGASGALVDPDKVAVTYGGHAVYANGEPQDHDAGEVGAHMAGDRIAIGADLGAGSHSATMYGSDLTHEYVDENMGTS